MQQQTKAYLLTFVAVLFWATAASAFKIALQHVTFSFLLFYAAIVLLSNDGEQGITTDVQGGK